MTFEEIHREQARHSDATADVADLHGVAPPCQRCGRRERADDVLCAVCRDEDDA